ncbi:hypothetical protein OF83DRAFT_1135479 [Amylostereum chailletii]|nr:hypothetical protein OF83DRAFT_1135479 [Amylostereum chailletii]
MGLSAGIRHTCQHQSHQALNVEVQDTPHFLMTRPRSLLRTIPRPPPVLLTADTEGGRGP